MKTIALGFSILLFALAAAGSAQAGQISASCSVVDVAAFSNRVHLHCTAPVTACSLTPGGCPSEAKPPSYVAVEVTSAMAPSVVQIGLAALTGKRLVTIFFDDNAGANPAGCNTNDCRRLLGVAVH